MGLSLTAGLGSILGPQRQKGCGNLVGTTKAWNIRLTRKMKGSRLLQLEGAVG